MSVKVATFYQFFPISEDQVPVKADQLREVCKQHDTMGLFILGVEGLNSTFSSPPEKLEGFQKDLEALFGQKFTYKLSDAERHPFRLINIHVRDEIVTLKRPDLIPPKNVKDHHISPTKWNELMKDPNTVVIDTRNDYEVEIGKFKNAIDFKIEEFSEFPQKVKESGIKKDQQVLIYCTGGIRCEKAILDMQEQGYEKVFQLDGGIINYLKEYPNENFEGECFVFDGRVAVDQNLNPTKQYVFCPHCGQPGQLKIDCLQCGTEDTICQKCHDKEVSLRTCSKNCANHHRKGHKFKRPHVRANKFKVQAGQIQTPRVDRSERLNS